jgi:hypothetical protein
VSLALVTKHAKHMHCIILSSVTWTALAYFSTLSHKGHDFFGGGGGKGGRTLNTKFVFGFPLQLPSETFLNLRKIQQDIILNVDVSSCKVPIISVRF